MNHVNTKTLAVLGGIVVVALVAAVAINLKRQPATEIAQQAQPALPGLTDHLNDIASVAFTGAGDKPIATLEKGANGWMVKEKNGFPADAAKLREYLLKLADVTLIEPKTASEKHYAELGVDDVKAADAKSVLVSLGGLAKPTQLIVGNVATRGNGTFVRRPGEAQSWLAKGNISVDKTLANWLDKSLADVSASRIKEVDLTGADGKVLRAYKEQASDSNFKIADLPKGRELSSEFAANGLGTALAGLRFDDVLAAKDAAPPADPKPVKAHYVTFDGLSVDATAWKKDEKTYVQFTASLDEAQAQSAIAAEQAKAKADFEAQQKTQQDAKAAEAKQGDAKQGEPAKAAAAEATPPLAVSDPAKDAQQRLEATKKEAASLQQRFEGWTYVLPAYRYESLAKRMDELLKPLESKKDDKAAKKPAAAPKSLSEALPGKH